MGFRFPPNRTSTIISRAEDRSDAVADQNRLHGTFARQRGTNDFKPSTDPASGLPPLTLPAATGGIRAVAHKMHQEILDIQHYPEFTFTPTGLQPGDPC
jgi:hypothetical protein